MKITVIHGQNHKGNTYMIAHELAEKIGGEGTGFFLPRGFFEPCLGCWTGFYKDLTQFPGSEEGRVGEEGRSRGGA